MSTCPERELLCVYVDGELPEKYRTRLEAHIAGCEDCKRHLAQLQSVQQAMQKDAGSLSFTDHALDESFARLKTKQSYRRVILAPQKKNNPLHTLTYGLGAIAAAAVLAVILPLQLKQTSALPQVQIAEVKPQAHLLHEKGVSADNSATLAAFASYTGKTSEKPAVTVNLTGESLAALAMSAFTNGDIFKPDLSEKAITITINLETVPVIFPDDAHYWQQTGGTPVSFSTADYK